MVAVTDRAVEFEVSIGKLLLRTDTQQIDCHIANGYKYQYSDTAFYFFKETTQKMQSSPETGSFKAEC